MFVFIKNSSENKLVSLSTWAWWQSNVAHQVNVIVLLKNHFEHFKLTNRGSLICQKVQIHVIAEKSVDTDKGYIWLFVRRIYSVDLQTLFRYRWWIDLMVWQVLIVSWCCDDMLCVHFLSNLALNKFPDVFHCLRSLFPFIMSRVIASHDDDIDLLNILLNIVKGFVKELDRRIALDTAKGFGLDGFSFWVTVFNMTADWQVANCWSFFSIVKIQVDVCKVEDLEVWKLFSVQHDFFISRLPGFV